MIINPKEIPLPKLVSYLQGTVAPRPIALVSSVDQQGNVNLSPFSFFNLFSLNPPILVFSPSRRARNNTTKHTLENVLEVPEVVINMIHYDMVQQVSLASCDFPKGVNEFIKAGLTEVKSTVVKPPCVGESHVSFECKVNQVIPLGNEGGAGNLVICEVQLIHINDSILDSEGRIDPQLLNAVARMGNDYYSRASGDAIFTVPKPNEKVGLGIDALPTEIRTSKILSGNDLGMLGNSEKLPSAEAIVQFKSEHPQFTNLSEEASHQQAKQFLQSGDVEKAWLVLMRN
ncbi:MAG: flavin reductase family protein [Cyclobacteriaceae bacterium]|jgi:flavin reductase (DIM6/NTAB) family NADH-FMN oxidoreductase RutF|nr:flavin reductase family protein [Flammeovirgaceae bacterium]